MSLKLIDVHGEIFNTKTELVAPCLYVKLTGCLDMETAPSLERFLFALTRALATEGAREVEFDTVDLYMLSSSSISHMAAWVKRLKSVSPASRIRFKTNPNLAWQRRTLDSIRRVAEMMVAVD